MKFLLIKVIKPKMLYALCRFGPCCGYAWKRTRPIPYSPLLSNLVQLIALKLDLINSGILRMWNLIINKIWPDCTIGRWLHNINGRTAV